MRWLLGYRPYISFSVDVLLKLRQEHFAAKISDSRKVGYSMLPGDDSIRRSYVLHKIGVQGIAGLTVWADEFCEPVYRRGPGR